MGGICSASNKSKKEISKTQIEKYETLEIQGKNYFIPSSLACEYSLETIKPLGAGAFGNVFEIAKKSDKQIYAVKRLAFEDAQTFSDITKEINILYRLLPYGNIVKFVENYNALKYKSIYIIMEKGDNTLAAMIKENPNGFPLELLNQLFIDMIFGLSYAYGEAVAHSDIKPANILVFRNQKRENLPNVHKSANFPDLIFKLTDFGAGTLKVNDNQTKLREGMAFTMNYASPEIILSLENENVMLNFEKCDVYSLAMTLILCCGIESKHLNHINRIAQEEKHDVEIEEILLKLEGKYKDKIDILRGMLKFDMNRRSNLQILQEKMQIVLPPFETALQKRKKKDTSNIQDNLPPEEIAIITKFEFEQDFKKIESINSKFQILDTNKNPMIKTFQEEMPSFKTFFEKIKILQQASPEIFTLKYLLTNEIYKGFVLEGFRMGLGIQKCSDGAIYCGNFKRDFISNQGIMLFIDGRVFFGEWRNGLMESGYLFKPNDEIYFGEFIRDLPDGNGVEVKADGNFVYGEFSKGKLLKEKQIENEDAKNIENYENIMNEQVKMLEEKMKKANIPKKNLIVKKDKKAFDSGDFYPKDA